MPRPFTRRNIIYGISIFVITYVLCLALAFITSKDGILLILPLTPLCLGLGFPAWRYGHELGWARAMAQIEIIHRPTYPDSPLDRLEYEQMNVQERRVTRWYVAAGVLIVLAEVPPFATLLLMPST